MLDNHITINILKILTPRHIDTLFRHMPVGELALFEIRLKEWKETDNISVKSPKLLSLNNDSCGNTPAFVKEPICSVSEILSSSQNGKLLLAYYMEHKEFKEEQRNLLVETITKYVEARGHNCTFAEYTEIGKQIGKIFPTESVVSYKFYI